MSRPEEASEPSKRNDAADAIHDLKNSLVSESQIARKQEDREYRSNRAIAIATLFFVIATTAGVFLQAYILHSSDITFSETLKSQRLSNEKQLRAYVAISPYRAYNIDTRGRAAQVYTTVANKGSTFAHAVERSFGISLLAGPVPEKFESLGKLVRQEGSIVLAPGGEGFTIQNLPSLSEAQLAQVMTPDGLLRIYVFGRITYRDEFERPHVTIFCLNYYGPERLPHNDGFAYESWQAKYCDRHNDAN